MKFQILPIKEQPLRNPKAFYIAALLLFVTVIAFLNFSHPYDPNRHQYDPTTREVLSETYMSASDGMMLPEIPAEHLLRSTVAAADIVIEGRIKNDGEIGTLYIGDPETSYPFTYTEFLVDVRKVWYGELTKGTIPLRILGTPTSVMSKPQKGDELILFLSLDISIDDPSERWYSLATGSEQSMFAINPPDNRLYAFDNQDGSTVFDDKEVNVLKSAIEDAVESLSTVHLEPGKTLVLDEYIYRVGLLGETYLNDNDASYVPQTDEEETE